ncbi:Ig-like domain-containing protein [Arthrobacter sp. 260]|uniref:Ig-like domain-containing protein n=1 Tax=Arthrobacter sp. 260 TaxID=2735314 RepID=UPI0014929700|nr:Ig-like domain-containing protein [Arthrobacter sp. 260]NOJ60744.1 Ig-like domain repeat protein [Arthrobacter sp. 260]
MTRPGIILIRPGRFSVLLTFFLTFGLLSVIVTAGPASARSGTDTRLDSVVSSFLDEPSWAFANRPAEIQAHFSSPEGPMGYRTGTLTLKFHQRGSVPETIQLSEDTFDPRFWVTPRTTGMHYYTVTYSGDKYYKPFKKTFSFEVWTGPETRTFLKVSTKGPVTVSQPVKLTAHVTTRDGKPLTGYSDGPIVFYSNGEIIGEGTVVPGSRGWRAELTVDYLEVGRHNITAQHETFIRYPGRPSAAVRLDVTPAAKPLNVRASHTVSSPAPYQVDAVAMVQPRNGGRQPTGYVQFYSGDQKAGLPVRLSGGRATYSHWTSTEPGTYTFRATYLGDTKYAPARLPARTITMPGS